MSLSLTLRGWVVALFLCAPGLVWAAELLEVFTRPGCPHCAEAKVFLQELQRERPALELREHDVIASPEARQRLRALSEAAGIAAPAVPTFVIGPTVLVGFDWNLTPGQLRAALDREAPSRAVRLPWVGAVDVDEVGLPLFTLAVGLLDGFNPCATWVLLFLLSMLVNLKDRRRMALIAGTFVVVSGLVYFAFMAAWLTFFIAVGVSQPVRIVLAVLSLSVGAINVKDFFAAGRGPSLSIPQSAKPGIYRRVRGILRAENLVGAMTGIVVLAVLVNLVELLCTAGLPALYTAILTARELPAWQYYGYLGLYILAYMLDDAVLVTLGVVTLGRRKLQEKGGRWLKLISGLVILSLGALLLLRPQWMGF